MEQGNSSITPYRLKNITEKICVHEKALLQPYKLQNIFKIFWLAHWLYMMTTIVKLINAHTNRKLNINDVK